jgi:uncharacterized membrane protein YhaH (DUF805 family)
MTTNPYTPPRATVADINSAPEEFQEVRIFSASGRIGRLRYLAYGMAAGLVYLALIVVAVLALGPSGMMGVGVAGYIALIVMNVFWGIQRAHDMGWSGWMVFLWLVPLAALVWLFKAGTHGSNEYGAPPPPNTTMVKVMGIGFFVMIPLLGILAALAIPAYQDYLQRAADSQLEMEQSR